MFNDPLNKKRTQKSDSCMNETEHMLIIHTEKKTSRLVQPFDIWCSVS